MDPVRLTVYSDYLCPWCYNAAHRLERLEEEMEGHLELAWRAYLLRPRPEPGRDLHEFVRYTQSWLRPAAEPGPGVADELLQVPLLGGLGAEQEASPLDLE